MHKHDIIVQCRRVRQTGDLSKNPEVWELVKVVSPIRLKNRKIPRKYKCRTFKNGIPKDKEFKLEEIEPLPSKTDLDIVNRIYENRQKSIEALLKPLSNFLKQRS